MSFISGLMILDAPASALNNAGADKGAPADNKVAVKKINTPEGSYPYVSAQAFRYWLRMTLDSHSEESGWVAAPIFREGKIAYTDSNPISNWDDDLFGYMRAPSKKEGNKSENATPLDKATITRVSPFRVGTFVSISPTRVASDFGTMSRHEGDPVPFEHEFYRAHLQGLFSLDLSCAGTFFDSEKTGFKNLDTNRIEDAEKRCEKISVRKQKAFRMPLEERKKRVTALLSGLSQLNGGAKQALHYTDLMPAVIMMAVIKSGNHPFYRSFGSSRKHTTEFSTEAFEELMEVYKDQFLSKIYIGWAQGFLDEERAKLESLIQKSTYNKIQIISHPKVALESLIKEINEEKSGEWFE